MDEPLKQRLVGAAVLISLGVIFLPIILDGGKKPQFEKIDITMPPAPAIDYETVVEPVPETSTSSTNFQTPPQIAPSPLVVEHSTTSINIQRYPSSNIEDKRLTSSRLNIDTQPKKIDSTESVPVSNNQLPAKPLQQAPVKPSTTSLEQSAIQKPVLPDKPLSVTSAWVVQVGSFSSRENAIKLRNQLRKQGFTSFTESFEQDNQIAYRVRIGPQISRKKAEQLLQKLKSVSNKTGIIVSYP